MRRGVGVGWGGVRWGEVRSGDVVWAGWGGVEWSGVLYYSCVLWHSI